MMRKAIAAAVSVNHLDEVSLASALCASALGESCVREELP